MAPMKEKPIGSVKIFFGSMIHRLRCSICNIAAFSKKGLTKTRRRINGGHMRGGCRPNGRMPETTTIHRIPNSQKRPPQIRWIFEVTSGIDCGRQYIGITKLIKVGRALENHIQLRDNKVSRFHALIRQQGLVLTIRDLNSTNGTRVNDQAVQTQKKLFPGDLIQLGDTVIRVESDLPVDTAMRGVLEL